MKILKWINQKIQNKMPKKQAQSLWAPAVPENPPPRVKLLSIEDVSKLINNNEKTLHIQLIKEGCRICKIPFVGGGVIFFIVPDSESELEALTREISKQLYSDQDYVVAYAKEDKHHPSYVYYSVIVIRSADVLDLKKVFKIQNLKAFL